jgi:hypothetical protein
VARTDLDWALTEFRAPRHRTYQLAAEYYDGAHRLAYDNKRFRSVFAGMFATIRANICQVVVDSLTDRLEIVGFELGDPALNKQAQDIWDQNLMDLVSNEVHRETFKSGDGYVIVQPDDEGDPTFWFNPADQVAVAYSDTDPGEIVMAAKLWYAQLQGLWRLNLYYPDHIEKYICDRERPLPVSGDVNSTYWLPYQGDSLNPDGVVPWAYGQVPVFHFSNRNLFRYGYSELSEIIPLQDAINKEISDLLIASEFSAFKQRWITGVDTEELETERGSKLLAGVDRIMAIASPDARLGEFTASDLSQYLNVVDHFMRQVARISGIPLHFIYEVSGDFPSGNALKTAEARFVKKLHDKQTAFGNVWERVLKFAFKLQGQDVDDVEVSWLDTSPQSQKEQLEVILMKRVAGVPNTQLFREMGYTEEQAEQWAALLALAPPVQVNPASVTGSAQASVRGAENTPPEAVLPTPTGRIAVNNQQFTAG